MKHVLACLPVLALAGLALVACQSDRRDPGARAAVASLASVEVEPQPIVLPAIQPGTAPPNPYSKRQVERGGYLVTFGGCDDCHTPWVYDPELGMPVPDMSRRLSGHPKGAPDPGGTLGPADSAVVGPTFTSWRMPFGMVYTMNLTPDIDTGTGSWTEEMFLRIFRTGRHLGGAGRPVLPPMPFVNIRNLTDEDLISIFAFLRSLPPIHNPVPSPDVPEEAMWAMRDGFDKLLGIESPSVEAVLAAK